MSREILLMILYPNASDANQHPISAEIRNPLETCETGSYLFKAHLNWISAYHIPVGLTLTFHTHRCLIRERTLRTRSLISAVTSLQSLPSNSAGNQGPVRNLRNTPNSSSKRLWAISCALSECLQKSSVL